MSKNILNAPFRADIVGSFLRPEDIKVARVKFAKGDITSEELKQVEDKCIVELIEKQKKGLTRQSPWQGLTKTPTIFKRIVV